jgi:GTP-binding protein HflX
MDLPMHDDRALLIQPDAGRDHIGSGPVPPGHTRNLANELEHLARSAGLQPVLTLQLPLNQVVPSTLVGKGTLEMLREKVEAEQVGVVLFNCMLTPIQQRNLEKTLKAKAVDRTGLILEIFAARAQTREGALQVELASLMYQQSRLVRSWTHLERQRGGFGMRGGPGETQIEVDRRLIRNRIHQLKEALQQVERTRTLHYRKRSSTNRFTVALVGYTNAGKSTLFNRLTGAEVLVEDRLFATLDPTMRNVRLPGGQEIILSDTVGFIRDLPHQLVAAFRSTLEEVCRADLILHVIDLADPEWREQQDAVNRVLAELGARERPIRIVFNKIDGLEMESVRSGLAVIPDAIGISALTGTGVAALLDVIAREMCRDWSTFQLRIPVTEGALLARLNREGELLSCDEREEHLHVAVVLSDIAAGRLRAELEQFHDTAHGLLSRTTLQEEVVP